MAKNLPTVWESQVQSLDWEDPLEKGMETHSSILAWKVPWTEEPGRLQSWGRKELDTTERLRLNTNFMVNTYPDLTHVLRSPAISILGQTYINNCISDQYLKTAVISAPALTPTHTTAHTRGTAVQNTTWQTISECLSENKESQVNRSKGL